MNDYLTKSEKINEWFDCLNAFDNWLDNHSITLKAKRLNNTNGIRKIIFKLMNNLDDFMENQENTEVVV